MRDLFFARLAAWAVITCGLWGWLSPGLFSGQALAEEAQNTAPVFADRISADAIVQIDPGRQVKPVPETQNIAKGATGAQDPVVAPGGMPADIFTDAKDDDSAISQRRSALPQGKKRNILVTDIINGACFRDEKWRKYCLAGIYVPLPDPVGGDMPPEPFAEEARALLYRYIFNRQISLVMTGAPNRWGTAYVMLQGLEEIQAPIQHMLLSRGLAYLAAPPEGLATEIYSGFVAEQNAARKKRLNIWQSSRFEVLDAARAQRGIGQYRFVRGTVLSTAVTQDRIYLNFGPDYRTDFTITIEAPLYRAWHREGFDAAAFEGRRIEVYGRLKSINGPSLALTDRQNLKITDNDY